MTQQSPARRGPYCIAAIAMNPNEVRNARLTLGLTQHELAVLLRMGGDGKRSVRRWEAGDREISGPASVAIEALLTGWRPSKLVVDE